MTRARRRHLGNFPQAFSHVALINTAFNLTRADKPAEQRSELAEGNGESRRSGPPKSALRSRVHPALPIGQV